MTVPSVAPGTPPSRPGSPVTSSWASSTDRTIGASLGVCTAGRSSMTSRRVRDVVGRGGLGGQLVDDGRPPRHGRRPGSVRTSTQTLGAGRDDVHLDRFPGPQHGRGEVHVAQVGVGGMGGLELRSWNGARPLTKAASAGSGFRPWCGIAPWAIAPVKVTWIRSAPLATWHTSPASGSQQMAASTSSAWPAGDEVLGAEHQPLLVDQHRQLSRPGEGRCGGQRVRGEEHRRDPALHVRRAAAVEPPVDDRGAEGVDGPTGQVALGHDVAVTLEEQGRAGQPTVDGADHVRATRRPPPRRTGDQPHSRERVGHQAGDRRLAAARGGVVDARDAHQGLREGDEPSDDPTPGRRATCPPQPSNASSGAKRSEP